jgi:hypothetical protein
MESNKTKKKINVMKQREINGNTILYLGKIFNTRYDGLYEEKNFTKRKNNKKKMCISCTQ